MTNVGLVGAGGIAGLHESAYREYPDRATLVGVCDVVEANAQEYAEAFDASHWTDYEAFFAEADVDAVDVTLPHHLHYPVVKAALEADKHVLVEKPFATSLSDCVELVELAEERDRTLMVGQMQRFHPPYRALKERVDEGALGTVRHARCDVLANQDDMFPPDHWLYDGSLAGGGGVIGYSVHKIDLLRYLLGDVRSATARNRTVNPNFEGAEDLSVGLLEFESGALADFTATLSAPAMPYTELFWLFGEEGVVHTLPTGEQPEGYVGTPEPRINARNDPDARKEFEPLAAETDLPTDDAFTNEILHFVDCVEGGCEPLTSGRDNLGTMAAVFGIYRSAAENGAPVELGGLLADAREGR